MRNPLELLKYRLDEMTQEYERIYKITYNYCNTSFKKDKQKDLDKIKEMIDQFRHTIRMLEDLNAI